MNGASQDSPVISGVNDVLMIITILVPITSTSGCPRRNCRLPELIVQSSLEDLGDRDSELQQPMREFLATISLPGPSGIATIQMILSSS